MSHALWISIGAVAIAAVIIAAVTWMLVAPGRSGRHAAPVLPAGPTPIAWANLLCERTEEVEAPACAEDEGLARDVLLEQWRRAEADGNALDAARLAQVLDRLGEEDPAVRERAAQPVETPPTLAPLTDVAWLGQVAAPSLERPLTGLMAILGYEVITWHAHPAARFGLTRAERVESLPEPPRLSTLAPQVARAVGVPSPQIFVTPARDARLVHINLSVAGRFAAGLAVGKEGLAFEDEAVMRFMLGRKLTFMRAEHLLCTAVDGPEDLRALHLAAAHVLDPGTLPEPPSIVLGKLREEALARLRQHLGDAQIAASTRRLLRVARERSVDEDAADPDRWERWLVASAETSFRVGLLACGDLRAALRILDLDGVIPGTHREHVQCYQALYRFYLSEGYAILRQHLTG